MTQHYGDCCLFTYVYLTEPRMTDHLLMHTANYMLMIGNQLNR